jgi:hypothetical protein
MSADRSGIDADAKTVSAEATTSTSGRPLQHVEAASMR